MGWIGNIGSGIGDLFKGLLGGSSNSGGFGSIGSTPMGFPSGGSSMQSLANLGSNVGNKGSSFMGSLGGGINKMFGGSSGLGGLGMMLGSQLIPTPKQPALPGAYQDYMKMMQGGGTPGMQSANQYYQGVLSGNNQGAYEAATASIDDTYEEEVRKLTSMYKTLRPGTDPTTDSTYQRDLAALQGNYAKQRALAMAGVQQGAASGASGLGTQIAQLMGGAIQPQIDQNNNAYSQEVAKRNLLTSGFTGIGQNLLTSALDPNAAMNKLFQQLMMKKLVG